METWWVKPVSPRGAADEFEECEPGTTHARIAESWANWRFGKPRAPAVLKFDVVGPDGIPRRYIGYKQVQVAPVFVDREPTLAESNASEISSTTWIRSR